MSRYTTIEGRVIGTLAEVRKAKNASIPQNPSEADLAALGVRKLADLSPPDYNPVTHRAERERHASTRDGKWDFHWQVLPLDEEASEAMRASLRDGLRNKIKAVANARIEETLPPWKQRNLIAKAVEIEKKRGKKTITPADEALSDALEAEWRWVENVRSISDTIEAEIASASDEQLVAYDNLDNHPLWPWYVEPPPPPPEPEPVPTPEGFPHGPGGVFAPDLPLPPVEEPPIEEPPEEPPADPPPGPFGPLQ